MRSSVVRHVAIVGAGFSGTLQAINLLRHDGPAATLIERAPVAGKGLAYGAAYPGHVLNVRAGNMSALPDDPGHFARWLGERGVPDPAGAFAERVTYGEYLREMLDEAVAGSNGRLRIVRGEVADIVPRAGGADIALTDGTHVAADVAVIAVGNLPPHDPAPFAMLTRAQGYFGDAWDPALLSGLDEAEDATILLIGTGLTAIDIALLLGSRGFRGRMVALSRRGLLPRRHDGGGGLGAALPERPASVASMLVRDVRRRAADVGWRHAVDALRPFTQAMWANASTAERARFLRHLRPWWDVHRHRLAPHVADRLDALCASGRLSIASGKVMAAKAREGALDVTWRARREDEPRTMRVARAVNCTGPQVDLDRTTEPLLERLRDRGTIRADSARLGIDVDGVARTIAANGTRNDWLYALGPMTRGAFWEIVAVPDIRQQTWTLARRLSNAQWVGGEGL